MRHDNNNIKRRKVPECCATYLSIKYNAKQLTSSDSVDDIYSTFSVGPNLDYIRNVTEECSEVLGQSNEDGYEVPQTSNIKTRLPHSIPSSESNISITMHHACFNTLTVVSDIYMHHRCYTCILRVHQLRETSADQWQDFAFYLFLSCDMHLLFHHWCWRVSILYELRVFTVIKINRSARRIWVWRYSALIFTMFFCMFCGGILIEVVQALLPVSVLLHLIYHAFTKKVQGIWIGWCCSKLVVYLSEIRSVYRHG